MTAAAAVADDRDRTDRLESTREGAAAGESGSLLSAAKAASLAAGAGAGEWISTDLDE